MLDKETQSALERSLTSGVFIDTQFYLFSRRKRDGSLDSPLPIYAHSTNLIHTSSYFKSLLCGGFVEDRREGTFDPGTSVRSAVMPDEYGYDSDSDLDEDEDASDSPDHDRVSATASRPDDSDERSQAPTPGEMSKISSLLQGAEVAARPTVPVPSNEKTAAATACGNIQESSLGAPEHPLHRHNGVPVRYSVVIDDIAFRTFKALVYYSYTGEIKFTPLRSLRKHPASTNKPLSCSPKSIYRAADKYDIPRLKTTALTNIQSQLSPAVVLKELFSSFTSRYPEVIDMEATYIRDHRNNARCLSDLPAWADRIVRGELPHASAALVALVSKLAGGSTSALQGLSAFR